MKTIEYNYIIPTLADEIHLANECEEYETWSSLSQQQEQHIKDTYIPEGVLYQTNKDISLEDLPF